MTAVREAAFAAHAAGVCVVPPRQDGSKGPAVDWKVYQRRLPTLQDLVRWYADPRRTGLGAVCGQISGGLELLDFDDQASAWEPFSQLVEDNGLGNVWSRIVDGYWERTPSGGNHVLYRSPVLAGALKLAQRAKRTDEKRHPRDNWQAVIETKGEGGYAVVAPTNGTVHASGGRYELLRGGWDSIATVTAEERDGLLAVARMLDERPRPAFAPSAHGRTGAGGGKPGDDFNSRTSWEEVLPRYGWSLDHRRGATGYWTRPGKDRGISASTNYQGNDLLWVFSTSTDLDPDRSYDRFGYYAVVEHGGDFRAAARSLADQGYAARSALGGRPLASRTIRQLPPVRGRRPVIDLLGEEVRHAG